MSESTRPSRGDREPGAINLPPPKRWRTVRTEWLALGARLQKRTAAGGGFMKPAPAAEVGSDVPLSRSGPRLDRPGAVEARAEGQGHVARLDVGRDVRVGAAPQGRAGDLHPGPEVGEE